MNEENLFKFLSSDPMDVEETKSELLSLLSNLGFSEYEAKAYLSLIMKTRASAEEVAEMAEIPRTSSYKVLKSLISKGFATSKEGRPTQYFPVHPRDVRDRFIADFSRSFEKLEMAYGLITEKGTPQIVYTMTGKSKIISKIGDMLDSAEESFFIASPLIEEIYKYCFHSFSKAVKRGVNVVVVTIPGPEIQYASEVVRKKGIMATDVLADCKAAMLASNDLGICGYTDNEFIVGHMQSFLLISLLNEG